MGVLRLPTAVPSALKPPQSGCGYRQSGTALTPPRPTHRLCQAPARHSFHAPLPSQAGLLYRAIKLNVHLQRWERALTLARGASSSGPVPAVLMYRARHLAAAGGTEILPSFLEASALAGSVDAAAAKAWIAQDKATEAARAGAGAGGGAAARA